MIEHLALAILLSVDPAEPQSVDRAAPVVAPVASTLLVRYRFVNANFVISRIEMTIDGSGRGRLTWERRDVNRTQSRDVRVSDAGIAELRDVLARMDFVNSSEQYQTKEDHSNLGETAIRVDQGGSSREVVFNYTKHRDADALGRFLRGIANREMHVTEIEVAVQHQPLETPAAIATLAGEFKAGRLADTASLLPLLKSIVDDASLPVITRNRAGELAAKIREHVDEQKRSGKTKGR